MKQLKGKDLKEVRKQILKEQGGICLICKREPKVPCVDHQHKKKIKGTGQIRGVLCSTCNVFLGKSENNCVRYGISQKQLPTILRATADYLEKEQYQMIHPSEAPKKPVISKSCFNKLSKEYSKEFPNKKPLVYKYKTRKNKKNPIAAQHLTKNLEKLFIKYNIEIKYIK